MRIVQITPGTGSFHCGSCLRDMALVKALRRLGHDVVLVPMYLPLVADEPVAESEIFFGGIHVYLQQQSRWFGHLPSWLRHWLDHPRLLGALARHAPLTSPRAQGELMLSMLAGADGRQRGELNRLVEHLRSRPRPDRIMLSNALLLGLAPALRQELGVKVAVTLQGEDAFVDQLPQPWREQAWRRLCELARQVDGLVAVSRYYRDAMARRLHLDPCRINVVYNGIDLAPYASDPTPASPRPHPPMTGAGASVCPPVIGYLARMCPDKGLHLLVDAFVQLHRRGRVPGVRLCVVGAQTPGDRAYVRAQQDKLGQQGLGHQVAWKPNASLAEKVQALRTMAVLSVPAAYGEAFGLYLLEAMAMGVPVVQPRCGAFPELLAQTGGGLLCEPGDPNDLSEKLETLLTDPRRARELGRQGCAQVRRCFTMETMARNMLGFYAGLSA